MTNFSARSSLCNVTCEGISLSEIEKSIWEECLAQADPQMEFWNDIVGSSGERFVVTLYQFAIYSMGLQNILEAKHNIFTRKAYRTRSGGYNSPMTKAHGCDIIICQKKRIPRTNKTYSLPLSHNEVKTWLFKQFLNPRKFDTHILPRFAKTSSNLKKLVYMIGNTKIGSHVKQKFTDHNIGLVTQNFISNIIKHIHSILPRHIKQRLPTVDTTLNTLNNIMNNKTINNNNMSKTVDIDNAIKKNTLRKILRQYSTIKSDPRRGNHVLEGG